MKNFGDNYIKVVLGVFIALSASRFIPHPPNFTSLISLSFYLPLILGLRFIPAVLFAFIFTDLIIGIHSTIIFTWMTVILIGLISGFFFSNITNRFVGVLLSAVIFFILTNFGVWITGEMYEKNFTGLLLCYTMALPFFVNTIVSSLIFSAIIEFVLYIYKNNFIKSESNYFKYF